MKQFIYISVLIVLGLFTVQLTAGDVSYDPEYAKQMLYFSKTAYCDKKQISNWSCASCPFNQKVTDAKVYTSLVHGTQGYVAYDYGNQQIVVAFRGSHNVQNWIDNLDYKKIDYPACNGCEIHKGFNKAYESISSGIMKTFNNLKKKYPSAKVTVTGHSLGGAMAELAALEIIQSGVNVDYFYTFGCPRVGNENYAQYFNYVLPQSVRVTHYKDPVPHVPLQTMGFLNVPTEVWYYDKNDASKYTVCNMDGVEEDPNCSDKQLNDVIGDHLVYLGISTECNAGLESEQQYQSVEQKIRNKVTEQKLSQQFIGEKIAQFKESTQQDLLKYE